MKKFLLVFLLVGCASKKETSTAESRGEIEEKLSNQIGVSTKNDLIEEFGSPSWCRQKENGKETCRFYRRVGTKWVGDDKRYKKSRTTYDEVIADFDIHGTLRKYKVKTQR